MKQPYTSAVRTSSLVFIDDGTADRSMKMNSEVYKVRLSFKSYKSNTMALHTAELKDTGEKKTAQSFLKTKK